MSDRPFEYKVLPTDVWKIFGEDVLAFATDPSRRFLEWNAPFYDLIAKPYGVSRGSKFDDILHKACNREDLDKALQTFNLKAWEEAEGVTISVKIEDRGVFLVEQIIQCFAGDTGFVGRWRPQSEGVSRDVIKRAIVESHTRRLIAARKDER